MIVKNEIRYIKKKEALRICNGTKKKERIQPPSQAITPSNEGR